MTGVHSDQVILNAQVNPGGTDTVFNFEYGTEPCTEVPDPCQLAFADAHIGSNFNFAKGSQRLLGLEAGTTYYYRAIATNAVGTTYGPDLHFSTYPFEPELIDTCPNVLARQQTGSALVSDCRGYELVSAAHAGGYDVESTLVPGQTPFDGYPRAENPSRALYGIHSGALPDVPGNPTNRGVDPYVATRGTNGWTTSYVGIPANDPNASSPFSSTLAEADPTLQNFAFGGPEICSPCFPDGSTGIPVHLQDGSLVQGMKGSIPQPGAAADGLVRKHFSADGSHFVFASTSQFEPAGNSGNGDVSIYDRNLQSGTTQVVSTGPSGTPLACLQGAGQCHGPSNPAGIAELDMSEDGSRILVGQKTSTDAAGNDNFHLYLHVGSSPNSIDLTPGVSEGVLFDGMTGDGSRVFFTTRDHLVGADTDGSADIYEATINAGTASVRLISTNGSSASNDDSCEPPGVPGWNVGSGEPDCSALAFAGGAGLASGDGTFYFLSPELLDGSLGTKNQANLYVVEPGSDPRFVATIDSSEGKPGPEPASHKRLPGTFLSGLEGPESLTVDQTNGDVYVAEREAEAVLRFASSGAPDNFTAGPSAGTNEISGQSLGFGGEGEIAVDNSPGSPLAGALYVTTNSGAVRLFASSGEPLGELTGFNEACGVAVDQSNGAVYVGDYPSTIWRFEPSSVTAPISNSDYSVTGLTTEGVSPCPVGADSSGHAFALGYFGGPLLEYDATDFEAGNPTVPGTELNGSTFRIYTDPENGDRYIDRGDRIEWTDSTGSVLGQFGAGEISASQGVAVDATSKHVYVSTGSEVLEYGYTPGAYHPIDNPAIVHAVDQAGTHHYGDFQITPAGAYAVFATSQPLDSGFLNEGHGEVYRYSADDEALECASCTPTNAPGHW